MTLFATLTSELWFQENIINTIKYLYHKENIQTIDVSHRVPRGYLLQAAYNLNTLLPHIDVNLKAWHIVLVGVMDSESNYLIVSVYQNYYVIHPNNGFWSVLNEEKIIEQFAIPLFLNNNNLNIIDYIKKTIFIIKHFNEKQSFDEIADKNHKIKRMKYPFYQQFNDKIICDIIFINYHNNIVVNITQEQFETVRAGRAFKYEYLPSEYLDQIVQSPNEVGSGKTFMYFNETNYLEIGCFNGNFAKNLNIAHYNMGDFINSESYKQLTKNNRIAIYFTSSKEV